AEEQDTEERRADGADARPDGVGGAERQGADREPQEPHARDQRDRGRHRGPEPGEPVRVLEPDGPADLEETRDEEDDPSHRKGALSEAQHSPAVTRMGGDSSWSAEGGRARASPLERLSVRGR